MRFTARHYGYFELMATAANEINNFIGIVKKIIILILNSDNILSLTHTYL